MKSFAFFTTKGGVGRTTLTFNIAHMLARLGKRTVVLDYDPQYSLSSLFLDTDRLEEIWTLESAERLAAKTVAGALEHVQALDAGTSALDLVEVADDLWLLPGHISLARFEQQLTEAWPKKSETNDEPSLGLMTALARVSNLAAERFAADVVLVDMSTSLGPLNRAALLGCDGIAFLLAPDLVSLKGLESAGPALRRWRDDWTSASGRQPQDGLPIHAFQPLGYVALEHTPYAERASRAHRRALDDIPSSYRENVLAEATNAAIPAVADDPHCIAILKPFAGLAPYAALARKPLFDLKPADGIGSSQVLAVARCHRAFEQLAENLIARLGKLPEAKPIPHDQGSDKIASC